MLRTATSCTALLAAALGLAACTERSEDEGTALVATNQATEAPPPVEAPPMVVSSPAYRCDDGRALYLDVMSDDSFVNVRDSRADIPVRLDRNPETERFEGEGRWLSGRGDTVRYAAPDRPEQACRVADV